LRTLIATLILALVLVSCGGTSGSGGRYVPNPGGFPILLGNYTFTFDVSADPDDVVGRLIEDVFVLHLHTTSSGADITAYDDFGRVWDGGFSDTDGTFMLTTGDEFQHQRMEISVTGTLDENDGSGQFSLTFAEGFGNDDLANITGVWVAEIV